MTCADIVFERLKANGLEMVCHVPDSVLAPLITRVESDPFFTVVPLTRLGRVGCARLGLDDVAGSRRLVNAHELSVGVAFQLAERMGIRMPTEVEILAVQAADTCTIFEGLTPAVEAAVDPLSREIYEDLKRRAPAKERPDSEDFRARRAFYAPDTE